MSDELKLFDWFYYEELEWFFCDSHHLQSNMGSQITALKNGAQFTAFVDVDPIAAMHSKLDKIDRERRIRKTLLRLPNRTRVILATHFGDGGRTMTTGQTKINYEYGRINLANLVRVMYPESVRASKMNQVEKQKLEAADILIDAVIQFEHESNLVQKEHAAETKAYKKQNAKETNERMSKRRPLDYLGRPKW